MGRESLRQKVLDTFEEYGGWWLVQGMAEWLKVDVVEVRKVYDDLEAEGLMEREGELGGNWWFPRGNPWIIL